MRGARFERKTNKSTQRNTFLGWGGRRGPRSPRIGVLANKNIQSCEALWTFANAVIATFEEDPTSSASCESLRPKKSKLKTRDFPKFPKGFLDFL